MDLSFSNGGGGGVGMVQVQRLTTTQLWLSLAPLTVLATPIADPASHSTMGGIPDTFFSTLSPTLAPLQAFEVHTTLVSLLYQFYFLQF